MGEGFFVLKMPENGNLGKLLGKLYSLINYIEDYH